MKLNDIYKKIDDLNEAASMNISLTGDSPQEVGELFKVLGDKDLNPEPMPSLGMRGDIEKSMDIMKKMDGPKDGPMPMKMPSDMPTKLTMQDENVGEDADVEVSDEMKGQINQWIEKYSKYEGGNGDTLPEGYVTWALDSGIATDFYEQNEVEAFNKVKGYNADSNDSEWSDEDHDDFADNKSGASPITSTCLKMLNKITGDGSIEDNAHIIDAVMNGKRNEDYANSPDEQHQDTKYMTKDLAGGLNKEKKSYPKVAGGDNPMALENKIREELKAKFAEKFGEAKEDSFDEAGCKKEMKRLDASGCSKNEMLKKVDSKFGCGKEKFEKLYASSCGGH